MGLLRIEDVAIGCLVSLVVGVLFWPRGAASVVGDDLADAFRRGAAYLTQAVDWALGTRDEPPDAGSAAVTAGIRLDEALRGFLAEQGAKRVSKEDLWMLVMASTRLRLTAYSLAGMRAPEHLRQHKNIGAAYARTVLAARHRGPGRLLRASRGAGRAAGGRPGADAGQGPVVRGAGRHHVTGRRAGEESRGAVVVKAGDADGLEDAGDLVRVITTPHHPRLLWVHEHLQHLSSHVRAITDPAAHVAEQRRVPWWR